ncbi:MAG: hypothetical protein KKA81_09750 [Bacteroidetes bacterium]|nr:hypothetical protein [Bacteroidota bacterium]
MKITFFRRIKPRQFDYKPIYWDPEKEEDEERKQRIRRASGEGGSTEDLKSDLRYNIDRQWRRGKHQEKKGVDSIRFIIYLFFAFFIIYMIFFTDLLSNFLSFFVK